ncbi:MAG: ABC transporter substrate-binding protein [Thermotogae bacterium]|nr:ABC transporter substrate-binding protein [Thermotogota bacterium]
MRKLKFLIIAFVVLLSIVSIAAETIKIAAVLPLTGAVAAYGQQGKQGILLANEMFPEVLGKKIEVVFIDTKSEKAETANAVARAIDYEKVNAIIGELISGNSLAGGAVADKKKVPMVSPASTNPLVTQGKKYMFRVCFIDPFQGKIAAKFAYNNLEAKNVVIFTDIEQDYCVGLANFFKKTFTSFGGSVYEEYYRTGDQDFSAQLTDALSRNPDILYIPGYYTEIALIARQARQFGFDGPILAGDGAEAQQLIEIGGDAVNDVYYTTHYHPDAAQTDIAKVFVEKFKEKYGERPSAMSALNFDAYLIIYDAIKRAGNADREKIAEALRTTKRFEGVTGVIKMGSDGNPIKSVVINKVENGEFKFVTVVNP